MKLSQVDEMKTVEINEHVNNVLNEKTAQLLEQVFALYGYDVNIEDVEWQVVYDLKLKIIEACEGLGLTIKF